MESWADFAKDLRKLADRAYNNLQEEAKEKLSLTRYLDQIADPQVSFGVKQSRPRTLDDAVGATLELESFKNSKPCGVNVMQVQSDTLPGKDEATVGAIGPPENKQFTEELLKAILAARQRLERLENSQKPLRTSPANEARRAQFSQERPSQPPTGQVICRRCGKEGHYARGCAAKTTPRQPQGN